MALFDLPLEQLQTYLPERHEPSDFTAFWQDTLTQTREHDLEAEFVPLDAGLKTLEAYDVTFSGFGGTRVKGWLLLPRSERDLPCLVEYIGYGGGRGFAADWLTYASAGYAHLVMDTRGQGSSWRPGDTPDDGTAGPSIPGFMTRGILNPQAYYYRRLMTDAVRAVEAATTFERVDASRLGVTGGSQGGGLALAAAGLSGMGFAPSLELCLTDVPFLCHYRQGEAALLKSSPRTARAQKSSVCSPNESVSRLLPKRLYCIAATSAVEVLPPARVRSTSVVRPRSAPMPPCASGTVRPVSPEALSAAMSASGSSPFWSASAARVANPPASS